MTIFARNNLSRFVEDQHIQDTIWVTQEFSDANFAKLCLDNDQQDKAQFKVIDAQRKFHQTANSFYQLILQNHAGVARLEPKSAQQKNPKYPVIRMHFQM